MPFGARVLSVKNLTTSRSVTTRVNIPEPFCKKRVIGLSKAVGNDLQIIQAGTTKAELAVVE